MAEDFYSAFMLRGNIGTSTDLKSVSGVGCYAVSTGNATAPGSAPGVLLVLPPASKPKRKFIKENDWNVFTLVNSNWQGFGTAAIADMTTSRSDTTAGRVLQVGDYGQGSTAGTTNLASIFDITCTEIRSAIGVGGGANATEGMPANSDNTRFSVNIYSVYANQFWVELISTKQTYTGMVYTDTKDPVSWTQHYTDHYKPAATDCDAVSASQGGTFQKIVNFNGGLSVRSSTGIFSGDDAAGFTSDNLLLKSWYGIGFYSTLTSDDGPEIGITGYINTRTGRLEMKEQIIPGSYGNFDVRYYTQSAANAKFVQGVQLGAQGALGDVWGDFNDHKAPVGCVITGFNGGRDGDTVDIRNTYYKPIQKNINGIWTTISG